MAVRATQDLKNAIIKSKLSATSTDMTAGRFVKFGTTDTEVTNAGAGDDLVAYGVAMETVLGGAARVQICTMGPGPIIPCIVGTGGVTRGVRVKLVADGVAAAATSENAVGWAEQTGVVGDLVGIRLGQTSIS
jgi:hypothetical protein